MSDTASIQALVAQAAADARALWAVRVLDSFTVARDLVSVPSPQNADPESWFVVLPAHIVPGLDCQGNERESRGGEYFGDTPDAARIAAAEALTSLGEEL